MYLKTRSKFENNTTEVRNTEHSWPSISMDSVSMVSTDHGLKIFFFLRSINFRKAKLEFVYNSSNLCSIYVVFSALSTAFTLF